MGMGMMMKALKDLKGLLLKQTRRDKDATPY